MLLCSNNRNILNANDYLYILNNREERKLNYNDYKSKQIRMYLLAQIHLNVTIHQIGFLYVVKLCASLDGSFKALRLKIGSLLRYYGSKTSTIPNATMISYQPLKIAVLMILHLPTKSQNVLKPFWSLLPIALCAFAMFWAFWVELIPQFVTPLKLLSITAQKTICKLFMKNK